MIDLPTWMPVAYQLLSDAQLVWRQAIGAPVTIKEAHALRKSGEIFMAQKRLEDRTLLVIKARSR